MTLDQSVSGVSGMLDALDVRRAEGQHGDLFIGSNEWMPSGRAFGGQVLAQAVTAAGRTVDEARDIHSVHGYFLRPGDVREPITLAVERLNDNRSRSLRRVRAHQRDVPIFSMISSFESEREGPDRQPDMPMGLPDPEQLPSDLAAAIKDPEANTFLHSHRAFDVRHIGAPHSQVVPGRTHYATWMRATGTLPDDPRVHRAVFAYASDYFIITANHHRHGLEWDDPNLAAASLDHAMWWHRDARADEWFAYVIASPSTQAGRGLAEGRIYSRTGTLIATVAQEGMIRWAAP